MTPFTEAHQLATSIERRRQQHNLNAGLWDPAEERLLARLEQLWEALDEHQREHLLRDPRTRATALRAGRVWVNCDLCDAIPDEGCPECLGTGGWLELPDDPVAREQEGRLDEDLDEPTAEYDGPAHQWVL
jgi:hypothetical protein